jgi:hypothetical protein
MKASLFTVSIASEHLVTKQTKKYETGMAGEFLVAGELCRRGVFCSVTYGNAKKADVVAFSQATGRYLPLEVKTTSEDRWVIGNSVPENSERLWVFVFLPPDNSQSPEYFVLSSSELNAFLVPQHEEYRRGFFARHNVEFTGKGVESVRYDQAEQGRNEWQKILEKLRPTHEKL